MSTFTTNDILTSNPLSSQIQSSAIGILIVSAVNSGSNVWQYDLDTAGSGIPTIDISNVSMANGLFIAKSSSYSIILSTVSAGTTDDLIKFYIVTGGTFVDEQTYDPNSVRDNLYQTSYFGYDGIMDITSSDILFEYPANFIIPEVTPINTYTPEQIKTVYNYFDETKVVNQARGETITSEVTTFLDANDYLPQFKSYNDYLAYKRSLTNQNYLFNRYK